MKYLTFALLLLSMPAFAADPPAAPRTIDMTKVLHDENGKPAADPFDVSKDDPMCAKCAPLTVGTAIAHALTASLDTDRDLPWEQKWALAVLADKLRTNPAAILTAQEISKTEARLGKVFSGVIISQIVPVLEPGRAPPSVQ